MLPDPDASLVFDPPGPILLSVCWGVQGARGEAHPLTPWVSHCIPYPDPAWESDSMASSGSRGPCDVALAVRWGVSWGICGESVASRRAGWPTYGERAGGPCIPPSVVGREGRPSVVGRQGRCPPIS